MISRTEPLNPVLLLGMDLEYRYEIAVAKYLQAKKAGDKLAGRQWWGARVAYRNAMTELAAHFDLTTGEPIHDIPY